MRLLWLAWCWGHGCYYSVGEAYAGHTPAVTQPFVQADWHICKHILSSSRMVGCMHRGGRRRAADG